MHLNVQPLRESTQVKDLLVADGWQVQPAASHALRVEHPEVADEAAARLRLERLGLLTSRCCHIDFPAQA